MAKDNDWNRILAEMFDPHRMARLALAIGAVALLLLVFVEVVAVFSSRQSWTSAVLRILVGLVILSPGLLLLRNVRQGRYKRGDQ